MSDDIGGFFIGTGTSAEGLGVAVDVEGTLGALDATAGDDF